MRLFKLVRHPLLWLAAGAILGLAGAGAGLAQDKGTPAAAMRAPAAGLPCDSMPEALLRAGTADRLALANAAVKRPCRPVPAALWNAIRFGRWADSRPMPEPDRVALIGVMIQNSYPEAESLTVSLLENGQWPEGLPLSRQEGGPLILVLKPALTPYRVRLMLDIYEQRSDPFTRLSILQALRGSSQLEAILPAVTACWEDSAGVRETGFAAVSEQPERTPDGVLARLIRKLPEGPALDWAVDLGRRHPGTEVDRALKVRTKAK